MSWFYTVARKTFVYMMSRCCSYVFAVGVVHHESQSNLLNFEKVTQTGQHTTLL